MLCCCGYITHCHSCHSPSPECIVKLYKVNYSIYCGICQYFWGMGGLLRVQRYKLPLTPCLCAERNSPAALAGTDIEKRVISFILTVCLDACCAVFCYIWTIILSEARLYNEKSSGKSVHTNLTCSVHFSGACNNMIFTRLIIQFRRKTIFFRRHTAERMKAPAEIQPVFKAEPVCYLPDRQER